MGLLQRVGLVFARKWVGGTTVEEAVKEAHRLNREGEKVIFNYLGEDLTDISKVEKNTGVYISLLEKIGREKAKANIAVKPTQLGLCISYKSFISNYEGIVKAASKHGIFVWLDMEDHQYINDTLTAYLATLKKYKNIGICIQSKLRRSYSDIKRLVPNGAVVRLVKGAYKNHGNLTFNSKEEVDKNYKKCMHYLFSHSKYFMIATHDDKLINQAIEFQSKFNSKMVFGMLKGIRPKLALQLVKEHHDVYIYVPFGEDWMEYSLRRLKEKEHSMLILRSIFQG